MSLPSIGNTFIWLCGDGLAMSIVDIFLLSKHIIDRWKVVGQFIRSMDISDHCPIWLKANNSNWDPKPFKFNNCWLEHPKCIKFMEREWNSFRI